MSKITLVSALHRYIYRMRESKGKDVDPSDDALIKEACEFWVRLKPLNGDRDLYYPPNLPETHWKHPRCEGEYGAVLEYLPLALIEKECAKYR
jgi:hypothetical protein